MPYGTLGNAESRLTEITGREIDANIKALAAAPPTGAATSAKQDAQTALLTTIDADTSKIPTDPAREGGVLTDIKTALTASGSWQLLTDIKAALTASGAWSLLTDIKAALTASGAWQLLTDIKAALTASGAWQLLTDIKALGQKLADDRKLIPLAFSAAAVADGGEVQLTGFTANAYYTLLQFNAITP